MCRSKNLYLWQQNKMNRRRKRQSSSRYVQTVLLLAWADGAISPEEESQLRDLRTSLRITMEEHTQLE